MIINCPLPRATQPRYHEGSAMRSIRDGDATSRQWRRTQVSGRNSGGTDRQMFFMLQKLARQRHRIVGGGGSTSSSGMRFRGEWSASPSDGLGAYKAQDVFAFTPDGGSAGMYIALKDPGSNSPDTGAPFWFAFPNSPPGVWA